MSQVDLKFTKMCLPPAQQFNAVTRSLRSGKVLATEPQVNFKSAVFVSFFIMLSKPVPLCGNSSLAPVPLVCRLGLPPAALDDAC